MVSPGEEGPDLYALIDPPPRGTYRFTMPELPAASEPMILPLAPGTELTVPELPAPAPTTTY